MKKIVKGILIFLFLLLCLFTAAYFYIGARAEKLLAELVEKETGGKLKTEIEKVRFNWKHMNLRLDGARFYSADTLNEPATYEIRVQQLVLELSALRPLLYERRLLFDTIVCMRPEITVTKRKEQTREKFSLTAQMNKVYNGLSRIVDNLNIRYCVADSGSFSLVNRLQPGQMPVTLTDFYLRIDNLRNDATTDSTRRSLFADRIKFYSSHQDILSPDGKNRLRFKRFRINSAKQLIEIDSCFFSRKSDPAGFNALDVFVDTLRLAGVDFNSLTTTGLVHADSALCINSKINFSTQIQSLPKNNQTASVRPGKDSAVRLVKNLLGDMQIGYLGLLNTGLQLKTSVNGKVSSYSTRRSDFIMEDIAVINSPDIPLKAGSFRFGIEGYRAYDADSTYAVGFDKINFGDKDVDVEGFSLLPTSRNNSLNNRKAISMRSLRLEGIDWPELMFNRKLVARRVIFNRPGLDILAPTTRSGKTTGNTAYFNLLRIISGQVDVNSFQIRDAFVDYQSAGKNRYQFRKVNFNIRVRDLLSSRSNLQLLRSLSPVAFSAADIEAGGTRVLLQQGVLNPVRRSLSAAGIEFGLRGGVVRGTFGKVMLNDVAEAESGEISAGNLSWRDADIVVGTGAPLQPVPQESGKRGGFVLHSLDAGNTRLRMDFPEASGQVFLQRLFAGKILLHSGKRPVVEQVSLSGNDLLLDKGRKLRFTAGKVDVRDGQMSRLSNLSLQSGAGIKRISVSAPELTFVPDIASLLRGDNELRQITLLHPKVSISESAASVQGSIGTQRNSGLPRLNIDSIRIIDPLFTRLPDAVGNIIDYDSLKTDWVLTDLHADGEKLSLGSASLLAKGLSLQSGKMAISMPDQVTLKTALRDLLFIPAGGVRPAFWKGLLSSFELDSALLSLRGKDSVRSDVHLQGIRIADLELGSDLPISLSALMKNPVPLRMGAAQLSTRKGLTQLEVSGLRYLGETGTLSLDSFSAIPLVDRDSFNRSHVFQTDYLTLKTGRIAASGLHPDSVFRLRHLNVAQPVLTVYKDKRLPFRSGVYKPLPTDMLQRYAGGIRIDSLQIDDGDITYEELNEKTLRNGIVRFNRMNALLLHVGGSGHVPGDSLRLIASASLLDELHFRFRFMQAYLDTQHTFNFAFRMSPFDMRKLNPVLTPLLSAKIKGGVLDTLRMNAFGREHITHGKMKMYYRGLRAAYLNNGDENTRTLKTRLITFLANSIILRRNNQKGIGQVYVERKLDRSVFNYWLKIILSGVISSTGVSSNKKVEREYFRSLRQLNLPEIPEIGL